MEVMVMCSFSSISVCGRRTTALIINNNKIEIKDNYRMRRGQRLNVYRVCMSQDQGKNLL